MILESREVTKKYGSKTAVNQVSLQLEPGLVYAMLGPNGSGKTTWMKMVAGLVKPTSGEILYQGTPIGKESKKEIAYMSTEPYFYNWMTVADVGKYYEDFFEDFSMEKYRQMISRMELTEDKIYQVFYENEIAGRVEAKILESDPVEISDEMARMTTFYDMYFQCYSIEDDGTVVEYTEEQKQEQKENALQACSTLATATIDENKDAENIEKLAEYYKLDQAGEQTLTPDEILETYGEDVYNLLYSMQNGDYSTVVETEYGYHVFQMIALTDQKATKARKETMTADAIKERISSQLETWQKEIDPEFSYPDSVNMELYDTIKL